MLAIPSELYIQKRVGLPAFRRGQDYFRQGAIVDARVQGDTLRALCRGSQAEPYRLKIRLDERRVLAAECSCPVGHVGRCKHTAALLLAWRHRPWEFHEAPELGAALAEKPRHELVAMLLEVLGRHPELEWLAEAPAAEGRARGEALSPELFRRQATSLLLAAGPDPGRDPRVLRELAQLKAEGERLLERRDEAGASALFEGLLEALLEPNPAVPVDASDSAEASGDDPLAPVVEGCVHGLSQIFASEPEGSAARSRALAGLFLACRAGVERGGSASGDLAFDALCAHASVDERRQIGGYLRHALGGASSRKRFAYGGLLLRVEAPLLDDEAFVSVARASGRLADAAERLVSLGRAGEAASIGREAPEGQALSIALSLERHGKKAEALSLVEARVAGGAEGPSLLDFLADRVKGRGKAARALELRLGAFRASPTLARYRDLEQIATPLGRWPDLRVAIRNWLGDEGRTKLLVSVCLAEGEVREAAEVVLGDRGSPPSPEAFGPLALQVARAAESDDPPLSASLYRELVEATLEGRGREAYRRACAHLKALGRVHASLNEQASFDAYVADVRDRHRALRALLDEMDAAGLGAAPKAPVAGAEKGAPAWKPAKAYPPAGATRQAV